MSYFPKKDKLSFSSHVATEGHSISFPFARRKSKGKSTQNVQLSLEDFDASEIEQSFQPVEVDPRSNPS
jgi:hypothetical protein